MRQDLFADELATYWIVRLAGLGHVVSTVGTDAEITPPLSFSSPGSRTWFGLSPELVRLPALLAGDGLHPARLRGRGAGRWARRGLVAAALDRRQPLHDLLLRGGPRLRRADGARAAVDPQPAARGGRGGRGWWVTYAVAIVPRLLHALHGGVRAGGAARLGPGRPPRGPPARSARHRGGRDRLPAVAPEPQGRPRLADHHPPRLPLAAWTADSIGRALGPVERRVPGRQPRVVAAVTRSLGRRCASIPASSRCCCWWRPRPSRPSALVVDAVAPARRRGSPSPAGGPGRGGPCCWPSRRRSGRRCRARSAPTSSGPGAWRHPGPSSPSRVAALVTARRRWLGRGRHRAALAAVAASAVRLRSTEFERPDYGEVVEVAEAEDAGASSSTGPT